MSRSLSGSSDGRAVANETPPDRLIQRLRAVSAAVILALIVFLVVVDAVGRLFITADFRVSEVFLGTLVGALMLVLGIEVASRIPRIGGPK